MCSATIHVGSLTVLCDMAHSSRVCHITQYSSTVYIGIAMGGPAL